MANITVNEIWAENSPNRSQFDRDETLKGIEYKGPVESSQLNGVAHDLYKYVDQLQRGFTAYNPLKTYKVGDTCSIVLNIGGRISVLNLRCVKETKERPLTGSSVEMSVDESVVVFRFKNDANTTIQDKLSNSWMILSDESVLQRLDSIDILIQNLTTRLNNEIQRSTDFDNNVRIEVDALKNVPSSAPVTINQIAHGLTILNDIQTLTYGSGSLFQFTASLQGTNAEEAYLVYIMINEPITLRKSDLQSEVFTYTPKPPLVAGEINVVKTYKVETWLTSNHILGISLFERITLGSIFGKDPILFYSYGQYMGGK